MEVTRVLGTVVPRDFDFMRRVKSDLRTRLHLLPHYAQRRAIGIPSLKENDDEEDESGDENDSEDENDYGEVENHKAVQTFWPRLEDLPHQISPDILFGLYEGIGSGH